MTMTVRITKMSNAMAAMTTTFKEIPCAFLIGCTCVSFVAKSLFKPSVRLGFNENILSVGLLFFRLIPFCSADDLSIGGISPQYL